MVGHKGAFIHSRVNRFDPFLRKCLLYSCRLIFALIHFELDAKTEGHGGDNRIAAILEEIKHWYDIFNHLQALQQKARK